MTEEQIEERVKSYFKESQVAASDLTGFSENFEIRIHSPELSEFSRVERHQKILALFEAELKSGELHALSIKYFNF